MGNVLGTQLTVSAVAEYTLASGVDCWIVTLTNEKGVKIPHGFPKFTIEQRIAEYGLDPADISTVIDLILHEAHVPDPEDFRNFSTDAAMKQGLKATSLKAKGMVREGQDVPMTLMNAPDRATALKAHQARIDEVKSRITIKSGKGKGILSKGDTTDPLQTIVTNHGVDPDRVKSRADYVDYLRAVAQGKGTSAQQMEVTSIGGVPTRPEVMPTPTYDASVRRRGLTVALLDT